MKNEIDKRKEKNGGRTEKYIFNFLVPSSFVLFQSNLKC